MADSDGKDDQGASVDLIINPQLQVHISLAWPERGHGMRSIRVDSEAEPELVAFICDVVGPSSLSSFKLTPELSARLRELKIIVPSDEAPRDVALSVSLPETLPPLLCGPTQSALTEPADLMLNPHCILQEGTAIPTQLKHRVPKSDVLPTVPPILWVDDPGPRVLAAYTLESEVGTAALGLLRGTVDPRTLVGDTLRVLTAADILVRPEYSASRVELWTARCKTLRKTLTRSGHATMRGLINPLQLAMYRRYVREIEREGMLRHDRQVPHEKRASRHREPLSEYLHSQLVDVVSRILGEEMKPSYSFFGVYYPDAVLPPHRDRPQCKWNVSLLLDADPETDEHNGWPLVIQNGGEDHAVRLAPGDGVLYSGTDVLHWRDAQPANHKCAATFLHFVPALFSDSLD